LARVKLKRTRHSKLTALHSRQRIDTSFAKRSLIGASLVVLLTLQLDLLIRNFFS
jgi:hypothetical protein